MSAAEVLVRLLRAGVGGDGPDQVVVALVEVAHRDRQRLARRRHGRADFPARAVFGLEVGVGDGPRVLEELLVDVRRLERPPGRRSQREPVGHDGHDHARARQQLGREPLELLESCAAQHRHARAEATLDFREDRLVTAVQVGVRGAEIPRLAVRLRLPLPLGPVGNSEL